MRALGLALALSLLGGTAQACDDYEIGFCRVGKREVPVLRCFNWDDETPRSYSLMTDALAAQVAPLRAKMRGRMADLYLGVGGGRVVLQSRFKKLPDWVDTFYPAALTNEPDALMCPAVLGAQ